MAVIDMNLDPSERELKWFGLFLLLFFLLIGGLVLWRAESLTVAVIVWSLGPVLAMIYYAIRPLRRPMYVGWMRAAHPIGWIISHLCLSLIYYVVLTPIGLIMSLCGRDPLQRKFDPKAETYWTPNNPRGKVDRYFRQY